MDHLVETFGRLWRTLMGRNGPENVSPGDGMFVTQEEQPPQSPQEESILGDLPEAGDSAEMLENNIPQIDINVQVLVTGQTFGSEQQFISRIDQHLKDTGMHLRRENYERNSDRLLLLFCPVVSRVGTDISNALENTSVGRRIILIVMHHIPNEKLPLHTDSRGQVESASILGSVDCRFSQASGLYSSEMNAKAAISVASMIQKHKHSLSFQEGHTP
ncbi:uncharacterized protein [Pleurodeles waltl]|uniref:uncharacterized protein isoform X1 n=1 Tax=Pleurodeles waltl TaxID=8319 RepID=UPI0037096E29